MKKDNFKVALISDVHGNLRALEKVIEDIKGQGVDKVFCLGDIVGYGPMPEECIESVRSVTNEIVMGNHEFYLSDLINARIDLNPLAFWGVQFSRDLISEKNFEFLQSLKKRLIIEDMDFSMAHGTFRNPESFFYIFKENEAEREIENIPTEICFIGHTHIPFIYEKEKSFQCGIENKEVELIEGVKYLINIGSVGQPRDNDSRSAYGIFHRRNGKKFFTLKRIEYDIEKTKDDFKGKNIQFFNAQRLSLGI